MSLTFFRRVRMEIRLSRRRLEAPPLPKGYHLLAWNVGLLRPHAEAKYRSFRNEVDANVFSSLGHRRGCLRLMKDISKKSGFLAAATWLIVYRDGDRPEYCGTIQGVQDDEGRGWIQNIGIAPDHRGRGLGTALITRSLGGFREAGVKCVLLEATAENTAALRLYRRLGFAAVKTLFKAIDIDAPAAAWA